MFQKILNFSFAIFFPEIMFFFFWNFSISKNDIICAEAAKVLWQP